MALVKKQSNNTKIIGIAAGVLVLGLAGYYLFNRFYLNPAATNGTTGTNTSGQVITNFGEDLLNDSRFTSLTPYQTNVSLNSELEAGQSNPFQ